MAVLCHMSGSSERILNHKYKIFLDVFHQNYEINISMIQKQITVRS